MKKVFTAALAVVTLAVVAQPVHAGGPGLLPPKKAIKQGPIVFNVAALPSHHYIAAIAADGTVGLTQFDFSAAQHYYETHPDGPGDPSEVSGPIIEAKIGKVVNGTFKVTREFPLDTIISGGNSKGQFIGLRHFAGESMFDPGTTVPMLFTSAGSQELHFFDPNFNPELISDNGIVVGTLYDPSDENSGYIVRTTLNSGAHEEMILNGHHIYGTAHGISANGKVVVESYDDNGSTHSYVWELNGRVGDLGNVSISSINPAGTAAVGTIFDYSRRPSLFGYMSRAVMFSAKGRKDLGLGYLSQANAVDDAMNTVGVQNGVGFLRRANGSMISLDSSIDTKLGITGIYPVDIRNGIIQASVYPGDGFDGIDIILIPR
jgi:probable HAF family extracellular repeat protein